MKLRVGFNELPGQPYERTFRQKESAEQEMARLIMKELNPDQAYTIRISEWRKNYHSDSVYGLCFQHELDVETKRVDHMSVVLPPYPEYYTMPIKRLAATAMDEIMHRLRNKVRFRGWIAPVSDFFEMLEKAQGWR